MYQYDVLDGEYVYDFIKKFFSKIMAINRLSCRVEFVRVGRHICFELTPV